MAKLKFLAYLTRGLMARRPCPACCISLHSVLCERIPDMRVRSQRGEQDRPEAPSLTLSDVER